MANRVQTAPINGDLEFGNDVTTAADTVPIALAMTVDVGGGAFPDFTFSSEAENPGSTGDMDTDFGLIYSGPAGTTAYFVVALANIDVEWGEEGTIDPDAEDTVSVDVYVNSTRVIQSDEGQSTFAEEATVIEFNVTAETVALTEGDVLRVALTPVAANGAGLTWDVEEGGEWSAQ